MTPATGLCHDISSPPLQDDNGLSIVASPCPAASTLAVWSTLCRISPRHTAVRLLASSKMVHLSTLQQLSRRLAREPGRRGFL